VRYAKVQRAAAEDLLRRVLPVGPDEHLALGARQAALDAFAEQRRFHLVWHRVWGVRLRAEMVSTMRRLADLIGDDPVTLIWASTAPAAFAVSPRAALHALVPHVGPESGDADCDLLLVAGDGLSGLALTYRHMADADEYELRSWGQFAIALDG
jgi:hypothetical protein